MHGPEADGDAFRADDNAFVGGGIGEGAKLGSRPVGVEFFAAGGYCWAVTYKSTGGVAMANRRLPIKLSDVVELDRRGVPRQVHFPQINGVAGFRIGPAVMDAKIAAKTDLSRHMVMVTLRDADERDLITWYEFSEVGCRGGRGIASRKRSCGLNAGRGW